MNLHAFLRECGRYLVVAGMVLSLAACNDPGEDGAAGQPGPGTVSTATALNTEVTAVAVDSPPVVSFRVTDQNGIPFTGLTPADVSFTIAQLNPGSNGEPSAWQNYINRVEQPNGVGPGTEATVQGTVERGTSGTLVNEGDGSYTYTFATDITNVTTPVAVPYDANRTHRIAMQLGGSVPVSNVVYTWRPSSGTTSGITSREIVKTDSCNECHGGLAMHGGGRIDTRYCVTCHNPGSTDANSGNTIDFKVMVHKLHMGEKLPSVLAGGSYTIWGHNSTPFDFSDVTFPQDVRNCTKCHDSADVDTPQADNWQNRASVEACGSCHDDVDFATGLNHIGGIASNATCSDCHAAGGAAGPVAASHVIPAQAAGTQFAYSLTSATYNATNGRVTAKLKITDPSNGNAPYALTEPVWATSTLRLNIAWGTGDYTNSGSGNGVAKAIQIAFLNAGALNATYHTYNSNTGVHTIVSDPLPAAAQASGSGSVAIEGYPKVVVDGVTVNTPVTSAVLAFAINDAAASPRRVVVDNAKCLTCHQTLSLHGNNRVNETAICVTCHNPNNTDIGVRPAGAVGGIDGKLEESIDFKRLIHAIHAADKDGHGFRENGLVVYGHMSSVFDYSHLRFPGKLNNCATCHAGTTYALPLAANVLPSVIDTTDAATDSDRSSLDTDPANDLVITPTAAVCSSCHDRAVAQAHMEQNGALFGATRAEAAVTVEVCEICHGPGRIGDVAVMHGSN